MFLRKSLILLFVFFPLFSAHSFKIQFPDEELTVESVLPLVDTPNVVLNRNVSLKFRVELDLGLGLGLDEPFYNKYYPTAILTFYLTDIHAISLMGSYYFPQRSGGGDCLAHDESKLSIRMSREAMQRECLQLKKFDALLAPYPQYSVFLNYHYSPYYGKISLSKSWVLNLSIYGFAGGGFVVSDQNDQFIAFDLGLGKKLYVNKWLGLRASLGFISYYGPGTARLELDKQKLRYSNLSSEQKRFNVNTIFQLGVFGLL